jgi:hypothetical protein
MTEGDTERTVPPARDDPSNATADGGAGQESESESESETGTRGRDVEVPFEVYKTVTVFSTLFAVGAVVVGFVLVDWGTDRATADLPDVHVAITLAGLASIALGAATYAFSTRFRAAGMGNAKDDAD